MEPDELRQLFFKTKNQNDTRPKKIVSKIIKLSKIKTILPIKHLS